MIRKHYSQMTLDERRLDFIETANIVHNFKYDYSKVVFVNSSTEVIIICPIHGEFLQKPVNHLQHKGCRECGRIKQSECKKSNKQKFEKRSNKIHNFKYDYSKVKYISKFDKVEIVCLHHGSFWQLPSHHIAGAGCPVCARIEERLSLQNFKDRSNIVHNFKYGYDRSIYITSRSLIEILCPIHGYFWQIAGAHLRGIGCKRCAIEDRARIKKEKYKKMFEDRANKVHNFEYNYLSEYVKNKNPMLIEHKKCKTQFWQPPNAHINQQQGCPVCGKEKAHLNRRNDENEILDKANKIHNYMYDYSLVDFSRMQDKVKIKCKKCNEVFEQALDNHVNNKQGCPKCNISNGENVISKYLTEKLFIFIHQKSFKDCINPKTKWKLRFDFYLPDYNMCIEFDGIQHFEIINRSKDPEKNIKNLLDCQYRDFIKNQYCLDHNIRLIRISYTDIDRIEEILDKELK